MPRKSIALPGPNHLITSFIGGTKRSADDPRIRSPTNETASPEKKNLKSDQSTTADFHMKEVQTNKPTPTVGPPQHDKNSPPPDVNDVAQDTRNGKDKPPVGITNSDPSMEIDSPRNGDEKSHVPSPKLTNPQRDKNCPDPKEDAREKRQLEETEKSVDGIQEKTVDRKKRAENTNTYQQKLPSAIRKGTYLEKAGKSFPPPILPQWKCHRIACMFEIDRPENKSMRTQVLANELNKMLSAAREYVDRGKVYVRKYKDHYIPRDNERKEWISQFDKKGIRLEPLYLWILCFPGAPWRHALVINTAGGTSNYRYLGSPDEYEQSYMVE